MIYKIPDTFKKILKRYGSWDNGYVFLLLLRRKWLINNTYLTEKTAKELFPSCEMCVGKYVITGDLIGIDYKINRLLSVLTKSVNKKMVFKGKEYDLPELYDMYPDAFSLLITLQPRDLIKASKKLTKKMVDIFMSNDTDQQLKVARNVGQEWVSEVQKYSDNRYPMVLVDIDYNLGYKQLDILRSGIPNLFSEEIAKHYIYGCLTPSGGAHLIFRINKETGTYFFKQQDKIKEKLSILLHISPENIEINSMSNKITHCPYFNSKVSII